jgi:nitronate monooxygenase
MATIEDLKAKCKIPAIAAPMFIVSGPELVLAACKAEVIGTFPALNARPIEELGMIIRHKVPLVITSVGHPGRSVEKIHDYGAFFNCLRD